MAEAVSLREVHASDIEIFFRHQADEEAARMASFPARDRETHHAHWTKILGDSTVVTRTIVAGEEVVGNIVSWSDGEQRLVGYWIGREHWGRGAATEALLEFLEHIEARPLYAKVAENNPASIRVLEKCGFERAGAVPDEPEDGVPELLMVRRD